MSGDGFRLLGQTVRAMQALSFLLLLLSSRAQTSQRTGDATSTAKCAVANTGSNNTINIKCGGITSTQGSELIVLMNKILLNSSKLDFETVNKKLDEVLRSMNPNRAVTTYSCSGNSLTEGPSMGGGRDIGIGSSIEDLKDMVDKLNAGTPAANEALLKKCTDLMMSKPEWLTPLLFCSVARTNLREKQEAILLLRQFEDRKGKAYDEPLCLELEGKLHAHLD